MHDHNTLTISEQSSRWVISPFWVGFWIVIIFGLIAHLVLPVFAPHLFRDGISLFLKDPLVFHDLAKDLASRPWNEFDIRFNEQFPAGILAFFYKLTGIFKPIILLPVLGVLAGITIRAIASCLDVLGVRGRWWPFIIGLLFTVTPTSISWMIYPLKDAFIVPGVIFIAWSFISVISRTPRLKHVIAFLVGSLLIFINKPYFAELFFIGTLISIPCMWFHFHDFNSRIKPLGFLSGALVLFGFIHIFNKSYSEAGKHLTSRPKLIAKIEANDTSNRHNVLKNSWKPIPGGNLINKPLFALAYTRERFLAQRSYGNTNYLPEIHLNSAKETLKFIPYALKLSTLEPLPWINPFGEVGLARRLLFFMVKLEMILVYISILLLFLSGKSSWKSPVLICICLSIPFLFALGFAAPNIGTINRYRFPFLILIKLAGLSALWNSSRVKWPGRFLMWADPPKLNRSKKKLLFLVPDDATFVIQRLVMAQGAQKAGFDVHVACPDEGYSQKIRELGFTFHTLDLNRGGLNPFADFKPFIRLVLFLAKERPDILQCVSIKPVIYGATAGTIVGLKKIVCLVNGLGYAFEGTNLKGKLVKFVAKALYKNAFALPGIRVIFQNPDDRDYFVKEQLVTKEKTLIIRGSGVNMTKFKPTPQPNNPKPVILFVGRLLWSKGIRELVEAAKTLKAEGLNFTLQIIGAPDDKNPEAVPKIYLSELHEQGIIQWMGRQTDMPHFYREADVVALPTVYNEGLPLTLLEAASTGRTLISTDSQGCREIVRHNVNGYLIPPHGVKELTEHLRTLIQNADLRKQFGEKSSQIVREEFSAEIVQQQLLIVYESLLNDSVRPAFQPVTSV